MSVSRVAQALVAIALVVAGLSACSSTPAVPAAAPARAAAPAKKPAAAPSEPVPVKLDALTASRSEPTDAVRNPFRFQPKAAPAPPRPIVPASPPTSEVRPGPVAPTGPPAPPPIPLKFLGVVQRANGVRWAVLSDGKRQVYGRETDIIDGQYRIVSIGAESIELAYVDGRGRQTVKLTGQ